jgi:hypothetical protein
MPAGPTYEPIATTTLGSAQSSVNFTNFGGYTDLVLVTSIKDSNDYALLRVGNGSLDTGSNYSRTYMLGNGSTATSSRTSNATSWYVSADISNYELNIHHIMNYSNTTTNKTSVERATADGAYAGVNLWRSTSAITVLSILSATGTSSLATGSTFTLYGIKSA